MFMLRFRVSTFWKAIGSVGSANRIKNVPYRSKFGAIVTETSSSLQQPNSSPVAVIFGWNSSKGRYLKKYTQIFEERSFDSICVPANPLNTFFRSGTKVKEISMHILDLLLDLKCQERPVFLYAFSNGGCAMFFHLMEALSYPGQPFYQAVPVVGTIFDSCPISPDINSLNTAMESVTDALSNPALRMITWFSMRVFLPPVIYFNGTLQRFMNDLTESPLQCPQLILYSKTDRLAPYQDIESYAEARRSRGINIATKCWDRSEHVSHYREHASEYLVAVNTFVDKCLGIYHLNRNECI